MDYLYLMLTGKIDMPEFVHQVNTNDDVRKSISRLIPEEAKNNTNHPLWECISYAALLKNNFDMMSHLRNYHKFDGTIADNLNIWGSLRAVYRYLYPDTEFTKKYEQAFVLYLDIIKDRYDGPEVCGVVEKIISRALSCKTKKQQREQAKTEILNHFKTEGVKRPRWIQGPEWPMGTDAPMIFISQKRKGEQVNYLFKDATTNNERIIVQHY